MTDNGVTSDPAAASRHSSHRHVSDAEVAATRDLKGVTDELALAFADLGRNEASTTVRVRAHGGVGDAAAMAALYPRRHVGGGKLYLNGMSGRGFLIALFGFDGSVIATFDGEGITAERTAAATALAIRRLAAPGASIAALFGTGAQSTWHIEALAQEMDLQELRLVGRDPKKVRDLVRWAAERGINAKAAAADDAVRGAAVVATVTSSHEPLFDGRLLEDGCLVCGVGSTKAERRELDAATVERARLVVSDSVLGAQTEAGDLIQAVADGVFDFTDLVGLDTVMADPSFGRNPDAGGIILFESQGIALEDVAGAWHVLQRVER